MTLCALTLNAGSSSIKFSLYCFGEDEPELELFGQVERIGEHPELEATQADGTALCSGPVHVRSADHAGALAAILECVEQAAGDAIIAVVGHRIVHGGPDFSAPVLLDDRTVEALATFSPFAPLHQPHNLAGVAAARSAFPQALQVGCFDTAFHRNHPFVNDIFAIPRKYYDKGIRRYGFHGLSYEYISHKLAEDDPGLHSGNVVVAHLGNGASMCAMRGGSSVGSTMGLSALDGLPMGTRCGQVDPGVLLYLMQTEGLDADGVADVLYHRSGLLGLSGISNDMRTLEASPAPAARDAIDYFVFRVRWELGALSAVLGGLDGVVFTGGIGEHSRTVRSRVCEGMEWLGIALDREANAANGPLISSVKGSVKVLVIPTDEEKVIARAAARLYAGAVPIDGAEASALAP
ncbi:MAG: acetate/propionate family kinase [Pseudomonadota bacterium]